LGLEGKRWDAVDKQPVLAKIPFIKPRKKGQKARPIQQKIKGLRCTLSPKSPCPVEVTLVYAKKLIRRKDAARLFGDFWIGFQRIQDCVMAYKFLGSWVD